MTVMTDRDFHAEALLFMESRGIDTSSPVFDLFMVDDLRTMICQSFADEANVREMGLFCLASAAFASGCAARRNDLADMISYIIDQIDRHGSSHLV